MYCGKTSETKKSKGGNFIEYYGNRLDEDQVHSIVNAFMEERYRDTLRQATVEDIRFALKNYLKRMTGEPSIYIKQDEKGEWVWDIVEEEIIDEAYYEHPN
jgi:hypothetical protein